MCDPVSIGLIGGSVLLRKKAQDKIESRQNALANAESERQDHYQAKSNAAIDDALEGFDPNTQTGGLNDAASDREAFLSEMVQETSPGSFNFGAGSANKVVETDLAKKLSETLTKGRDFAKRTGSMGALGDLQFTNSINLAGTGRKVRQMHDFSRGSNDVLSQELVAAQSAGDKYSTLADIVGGAGQIYSMNQMMQPGMGMRSAYPVGDAYGPSIDYYRR